MSGKTRAGSGSGGDHGQQRPKVVPANAVDVNAYFGGVNGDHHLDGLDKALIANVASTAGTGFSAFTLLDPAIIGDLSAATTP